MDTLKRVVNRHEEIVLYELETLAPEYKYRVYTKIRLADIFNLQRRSVPPALFSFALKGHFDFVVCNTDHKPLFAVEFDGNLHRKPEQKTRDAKKDELCSTFEFPILRLNSNHIVRQYNGASILRWIVSVWELQKEFCEGQERGTIPPTEDFDPFWVFHPGSTLEERHPHWISLRGTLCMERLYKEGKVKYPVSSGAMGIDGSGNYRGIEYIKVDNERVICVESAMRQQNFPIYFGDLFDELMRILLFDKLKRFVETGEGASAIAEVRSRLRDHQKDYGHARAHSCGTL